nr:hypothetical protein [Nannocystis sp.]
MEDGVVEGAPEALRDDAGALRGPGVVADHALVADGVEGEGDGLAQGPVLGVDRGVRVLAELRVAHAEDEEVGGEGGEAQELAARRGGAGAEAAGGRIGELRLVEGGAAGGRIGDELGELRLAGGDGGELSRLEAAQGGLGVVEVGQRDRAGAGQLGAAERGEAIGGGGLGAAQQEDLARELAAGVVEDVGAAADGMAGEGRVLEVAAVVVGDALGRDDRQHRAGEDRGELGLRAGELQGDRVAGVVGPDPGNGGACSVVLVEADDAVGEQGVGGVAGGVDAQQRGGDVAGAHAAGLSFETGVGGEAAGVGAAAQGHRDREAVVADHGELGEQLGAEARAGGIPVEEGVEDLRGDPSAHGVAGGGRIEGGDRRLEGEAQRARGRERHAVRVAFARAVGVAGGQREQR